MKTLIPLATVLLLAACTAPPNNDVPLQAQAPAPLGTPSNAECPGLGHHQQPSRQLRQPMVKNAAIFPLTTRNLP